MTRSFFFFGTLCDSEVLELVLDRPVDRASIVPATIAGYRACAVELDREMAPVLIKDEGGHARGVVVHKLTDIDVQRIAHFEGLDYESGECEVTIHSTDHSTDTDRSVNDDASTVKVQAWLTSGFAPKTSVPWNQELWEREHKPLFLALARSWMSFFRNGDLENTDFDAANREWDRIRNGWLLNAETD